MSYEDGLAKMVHPMNREQRAESREHEGTIIDEVNPADCQLPTANYANLDGFMIGRASFGNPWCFIP